MPIVAPGSKVLVSGANGFLAVWIVRTLLERGYAVRGTVRSPAKGRYLQEAFKSYRDKFEIAVVEDITREGAFDEAVKGVDAIEHTASPVNVVTEDPQGLIVPAVNGTAGIIQSVLKNRTSVRRIVVTSSCAAILGNASEPRVFTESDWNEQAVIEVEEKGKQAMNFFKYQASKVLAERAAWDLYNKNKSDVSWDLVVITPPYIFGPIIHDVLTLSTLNASSRELYNTILVEGSRSLEALSTHGGTWVDVRDIAEAHVRVLDRDAAGGERIMVSSGPFVWQDWIDVANSLSPSPIPSRTPLAIGVPGAGRNATHNAKLDTRKEARILGIKYRTMEETTRDTLASFEARGW